MTTSLAADSNSGLSTFYELTDDPTESCSVLAPPAHQGCDADVTPTNGSEVSARICRKARGTEGDVSARSLVSEQQQHSGRAAERGGLRRPATRRRPAGAGTSHLIVEVSDH